MQKNPLISVIMPVYNGEKYLREAIESILNQTYTDFEFIILNDGSTDTTEEIILSYDDPRMVYVKNEKNLQIVKTLNKGIALAKGKYVARMDADDLSFPERFEVQIKFLEKNKDIDICGTYIKFFGKKYGIQKYPTSHEEIKVNLLFNAALAHPSVMARRSFFIENAYEENYNKAEDYALWVKTIDKYRFANIPSVLLAYRNHEYQTDKNYQVGKANKSRAIMLALFGDDITQQDLFILHKIATYQYVPTKRVEKLYFKLLDSNLQKKIYDQVLLGTELFKRYRSMMDAHTNKGLKHFFDFFTSALNSLDSPMLKYQLKFFIKCLLRYSSEQQ